MRVLAEPRPSLPLGGPVTKQPAERSMRPPKPQRNYCNLHKGLRTKPALDDDGLEPHNGKQGLRSLSAHDARSAHRAATTHEEAPTLAGVGAYIRLHRERARLLLKASCWK